MLDSRLRTPVTANLIAEDPGSVLLFHTQHASTRRVDRLQATGVQCQLVNHDTVGRVDVAHCMKMLSSIPVAAVLVEGGASVHGAFVDAKLVDEAYWFMAPRFIGGTSAPTAVGGVGHGSLTDSLDLRFEAVQRHGGDLEIHAVSREAIGVHRPD